VSEFLVVYLDSIDERLLDFLDEAGEMRPDTVRRLRFYTTALLDGSVTPAAVAEDWPDWYDLIPAFVAAYAPGEVEELEEAAAFLETPRPRERRMLGVRRLRQPCPWLSSMRRTRRRRMP
jgi:hypothetical protein